MRRLAALALLIVGCSSSPDPAADRLSPGQPVIFATGHQDEIVLPKPPGGGDFVRGEPGFHVGYLYAGDTAQVVTDEDPAPKDRRVTVKVLTAKYSDVGENRYRLAGTVCTVPRVNLRTMKRE